MRRYLNYEHRSTVRLDIERTPAILFELKSGSCLFEYISVGQLNPSKTPFREPFENWLCTEDFEPSYYEVNWEVSTRDEERFHPISAPEKGAILQKAIGRKGEPTNVLKLSHPSSQGNPSQLRFRRRVKWDNFVLKYEFRPTGDEPFLHDPLCAQLPEGTEREILLERENEELLQEDSEEWNKVRLEYRRIEDNGNWTVEVKRIVNDEHQSTTRLKIDRVQTILFDVKSGAGIFDWIDIRRLKKESGG